jgi:hypothetical protein
MVGTKNSCLYFFLNLKGQKLSTRHASSLQRTNLLSKLLSFFMSPSASSSFSENEEREKRKQQILAVSIALTAMVVYACKVGIIKFTLVKSDIEYIET